MHRQTLIKGPSFVSSRSLLLLCAEPAPGGTLSLTSTGFVMPLEINGGISSFRTLLTIMLLLEGSRSVPCVATSSKETGNVPGSTCTLEFPSGPTATVLVNWLTTVRLDATSRRTKDDEGGGVVVVVVGNDAVVVVLTANKNVSS